MRLFPMLVEGSTLWRRRQIGESLRAQSPVQGGVRTLGLHRGVGGGGGRLVRAYAPRVLSREALGPWLYIEVLGVAGGQDGRGTGGADLRASQKHLLCLSFQQVL